MLPGEYYTLNVNKIVWESYNIHAFIKFHLHANDLIFIVYCDNQKILGLKTQTCMIIAKYGIGWIDLTNESAFSKLNI
jgi:hypothetical protein